MRKEWVLQLETQGWMMMKARLSAAQVRDYLDRLEYLWAEEGDRAGEENYIEPGIRRLANLANKGDLFRAVYADREVLEAVKIVMGPNIRVSMVNARDVPPQTGVFMPFHMDSDGDRQRDGLGYIAATAIWMLDPFTVENGATAFVPGSHLIQKSPKQVLDNLKAAHPEEIILEGEPGDVLVFNGHCWHAGRPNRTDHHRRAILVHYLRADVPRPENRRQHLDPDYARTLPPRIRTMLGLDD